jgi:predicted acyltransferase
MHVNPKMKSQSERIASIDQFRGTAILAMVLANFIAGIDVIPAWLKHADDIGYTLVDLVAPLFIFAIGLTFERSFQRRRMKFGNKRAVTHFITRYLALIGLGAVISVGETSLGIGSGNIDWGVLQAIGVAGMVTLAVIWLKPAWRALVGILFLGVYQFFLEHF